MRYARMSLSSVDLIIRGQAWIFFGISLLRKQDSTLPVGSISLALSCLVCVPPREEPSSAFGARARAPFANSGWWSSLPYLLRASVVCIYSGVEKKCLPGQSPLSDQLPFFRGWPLNRDSDCSCITNFQHQKLHSFQNLSLGVFLNIVYFSIDILIKYVLM